MQAVARSSRPVRCGPSGRRAERVATCAVPPKSDAQPGSLLPQHIAAGVLATVATVSLVMLPPSAQAVSGGGGISVPISYEDFSGKDLRKFKYTKAIMRSTNFSNTNLEGVSFFGGIAVGANFHGANLTNADLESGVFEGADFSDAILVGAFVNNAQFEGANIKGSDWTDVILRKDINKYLCSRAEGTNPVTGVDTRESLMCE